MTALRIDRSDTVVVPDVRVYLAIHVFELVQLVHRIAAVDHVDRPRNLEIRWVDKPDATRTVAHNQRLSIRRQSPTFVGVIELAGALEGLRIVDKTHVVLP